MRRITIEGVLNGWVITVGCSTLVSEDKDKMLSEIGRYIDDPEAVEKQYLITAKNKPNSAGEAIGTEEAVRGGSVGGGETVCRGSGGSRPERVNRLGTGRIAEEDSARVI